MNIPPVAVTHATHRIRNHVREGDNNNNGDDWNTKWKQDTKFYTWPVPDSVCYVHSSINTFNISLLASQW